MAPPVPLRVTHVMGTFHVGGLERLVLDLAIAGAEHGVKSQVFAFMEDGAFREAFDAAGVETRFLETRPGLSLSLPIRLAAALRAVGTDVVHAHHFAPYLYSSAACALTGMPLVVTEHSREVYDSPRRRRAARIMDRRAAAVVSVSDELAAWRVQALGTLREGLPLALLEGMANGLPAVATDVGEVGSLVSGGCGVVVPPGDPLALAAALDRYVADPALRIREGRAARSRVVEKYARRQMVSEYVALYRAAQSNRRAPAR